MKKKKKKRERTTVMEVVYCSAPYMCVNRRIFQVQHRFYDSCIQNRFSVCWYKNHCQLFVSQKVWSIGDGRTEIKHLLHKLSRESFLNSFFAKFGFHIDGTKILDFAGYCKQTVHAAQIRNFCRLTERALGLFEVQISEDTQVLLKPSELVCKVSCPPWFTCRLWRRVK